MAEKLVRDKIPEIIRKSGRKAKTRRADEYEVKELLLEKILEEAHELRKSGKKEELADILEAIYSLMKAEDLSLAEIEKIRIKKAKERGSFDERTVLDLD
jgi:predicted house-cleaning noncanonical NTP pyrophosphatase (MazG superfamily)